jgi:hypothetical protein
MYQASRVIGEGFVADIRECEISGLDVVMPLITLMVFMLFWLLLLVIG